MKGLAMKNPERTVLVDMDGTVADLNGAVLDIMRSEYPHIQMPVQKNFYFEKDLAPEHQYLSDEILSRPGLFASFEVIDGALDGWEALLEKGYKPRICTAPLRKNKTSIIEKMGWLEEHFVPRFGHTVVDAAIVDKQKYRHVGLGIIDDRPALEHADRASWEHIVFDQTYNQDSRAQYRMLNWFDKSLFVALGSLANREI